MRFLGICTLQIGLRQRSFVKTENIHNCIEIITKSSWETCGHQLLDLGCLAQNYFVFQSAREVAWAKLRIDASQ